jgi:hypothetical protein
MDLEQLWATQISYPTLPDSADASAPPAEDWGARPAEDEASARPAKLTSAMAAHHRPAREPTWDESGDVAERAERVARSFQERSQQSQADQQAAVGAYGASMLQTWRPPAAAEQPIGPIEQPPPPVGLPVERAPQVESDRPYVSAGARHGWRDMMTMIL